MYVDGQYVRTELKKGAQSDEFDPRKPAGFLQNHFIAGGQLLVGRIFYYDALNSQGPQEEQRRQSDYFSKLQRLPDTHVVLGQVRRGAKRRERKRVDVQMAVDAPLAATRKVTEAIALVTGDADFASLARANRDAGPHVIVIAFDSLLSESLAKEADRVEILPEIPLDWALS